MKNVNLRIGNMKDYEGQKPKTIKLKNNSVQRFCNDINGVYDIPNGG